jgi:diguanylate cyclase (GGDEF)-like protein/PAS domain S-box-containing protein
MFVLDMRTIIFSYMISNGICAAVMGFLWLQNRKQIDGLNYWLADYLMQFTAILLIALRGAIPDFLSMVVSNTLVAGGTFFLLIGLEQYLGLQGRHWHNLLYMGLFAAIHTYFVFLQPNLLVRNINVSISIIISSGQCAWLLLARVKKEVRNNTKIAGFVFLGYATLSAARIFIDVFTPHVNDFFQSGLYDSLIILTCEMLFVGLTFSLLLMVNRRLYGELAKDIEERKTAEEALRNSEAKFSIAFQNHPDAIVITSLKDGKIIEANDSFFRMSGYARDETFGKTTVELRLWKIKRGRNRYIHELQKTGRVLNYETNFRRKSGEVFTGWISSGFIQIRKMDFILTVIHDVSDWKKTEETLRLDSQIMAHISDGILLYREKDQRILFVNPQFEQLFGYQPDELIGNALSVLDTATGPQNMSQEISESLRKKGSWDGEIQNVRKDGTRFWSHASISSFTHSKYGLVGVSVQQDITKRKQAESKLEYLSNHDSLTGLYNRTFFDEELKRLEHGRQFPISIVMLDLDRLKNINDMHGHPAGDQLLQRTAKLLNQSFRSDDVVARIGGDEFAALLPLTDGEALKNVVNRICRNMVEENQKSDFELLISIGTSTAKSGDSLSETLRLADQVMYAEKSRKKILPD